MTSPQGGAWSPKPELLAAYFDGEFEGREDLAALRLRLEAWLAANPHGRAELFEHRRLRRLWLDTSPPEPPAAAWHSIQSRLEQVEQDAARHKKHQPHIPIPPSARHASPKPRAARLVLAAACVFLSFLLWRELAGVADKNAAVDEAPFLVASASEVVILYVEGADTGAVVVGALPIQGPLEIAGPGDVTLTSVKPDEHDNMVPEMHVSSSGRPIIWARAEADED
jgi:hypothetical protein